MTRGATEITQVSATTTTTTNNAAFKVEKKAQQAKAEAARRVAARKAKAASVRRKAEYRTNMKADMKKQREATMKQTQALEKRQRDRLAKQRGNANAKKIAVRKAAARRAADKVVSDAQKRSEAAERALEVKKQNSLKMSLEMKGVAQANLEAGEAAKAKRDVSRKDRADETRREAATRANANANLKKQRDAAVAQAQAMEKPVSYTHLTLPTTPYV